MVKKGDTLIEVLLAVGIFSLIAISVVAVMNSGTSEAQLSLETTLTREEIDAQADALRFIHESYINDRETKNQEVASNALWKTITANAIKLTPGEDANSEITNYAPTVCPDFKNKQNVNDTIYKHAFIIDTHQLNADSKKSLSGDISHSAYVPASSGKLIPTLTYPRLVYSEDEGTLIEGTSNDVDNLALGQSNYIGQSGDKLRFAEGIYIIAVADSGTTALVDVEGGESKDTAFYDFYIRSCWYGINGDSPSTISTVIRLHDPDSSELEDLGGNVHVIYDNNCPYGICKDVKDLKDQYARSITPASLPNISAPNAWYLEGWCETRVNPGGTCPGQLYTSTSRITNSEPNKTKDVTLYGVWKPLYAVVFCSGANMNTCNLKTQTNPSQSFAINTSGLNPPKPAADQEFQGWSPNDQEPFYQHGSSVTVTASNRVLYLHPVWRKVITFANAGWKDHPSGTSDSYWWGGCEIFNLTRPSSGYYRQVSKGARYGYYNTAPMDGYIVSTNDGKHVEITTDSNRRGIVNLQGFCGPSANEGVYYEIEPNDTFELTAKMNTGGMSTHPGGRVTVSIGPLTATINEGNITSNCQGAGKTKWFSVGDVLTLKLRKYGNDYSLSINNEELKTCSVASSSNVRVGYYMYHYSHGCEIIFNVQLYDIDMKQSRKTT